MTHTLQPNLKSMGSVLHLDLIEILGGLKRGWFLMYIREDIASHQVFCKSQCYIEIMSVKINLKKRK